MSLIEKFATADRLYDRVLIFQDIVEDIATYAKLDAAEPYKQIRQEILSNPDLSSVAPQTLRDCRTSNQFRREMQKLGGYKERRLAIEYEFTPLLDAIEHGADFGAETNMPPPTNWAETSHFRLFVSHIAEHKNIATRLKECLTPYAINAFVAHEDIQPTLEWQTEIERALNSMDAFLAIHTVGFSKSIWTQQEIGYAVARGVKIISFKMGEDPTGFISVRQALPHSGRRAEEIAEDVDKLLSKDKSTLSKLLAAKQASEIVQTSSTDEIPF